MARGILSGAVWGTVLSVAGLGTLSVLEQSEADQRDALAEAVRELTDETSQAIPEVAENEPASDVAEPESAPADDPSSVGEEANAPTQDDVVVHDTNEVREDASTEEREAAAAPEEPETDSQGVADAETAPEPETFEPVGTLESAETSEAVTRPTDVTDASPETGTPMLETPQASTDASPESTASVPTPTPETGDIIAGLTQPDTSDSANVAAPSQSSVDAPDTRVGQALDAPDQEVGLNVATEPAAPPALSDPTPEAESEVDTETAQAESTAPSRPVVRQLVPSTPDSDVENGAVETAALTRPAIGKPAGSLVDRNANTPSRLPTIGGETETETAPTEDVALSQGDTRPALERFAADVGATDPNLPQMAIVLLDDGSGPLGPDTLDNFPFPVTFALDPGQPEVAGRMADYRARGYEVATLANLPQGAQPTDVEQMLAGALAAVPESVALIEAPGGGLQTDRASTEQTAAIVAESGHGLVFLPNGLNTAEAIARRENVPAVSVLRDFDGEGQDARTKRRFLDGAAFRARQDGSVVMLGRLTPDTVSALLLWSLQDRASSVAMVPVSAILSGTSQ